MEIRWTPPTNNFAFDGGDALAFVRGMQLAYTDQVRGALGAEQESYAHRLVSAGAWRGGELAQRLAGMKTIPGKKEEGMDAYLDLGAVSGDGASLVALLEAHGIKLDTQERMPLRYEHYDGDRLVKSDSGGGRLVEAGEWETWMDGRDGHANEWGTESVEHDGDAFIVLDIRSDGSLETSTTTDGAAKDKDGNHGELTTRVYADHGSAVLAASAADVAAAIATLKSVEVRVSDEIAEGGVRLDLLTSVLVTSLETHERQHRTGRQDEERAREARTDTARHDEQQARTQARRDGSPPGRN